MYTLHTGVKTRLCVFVCVHKDVLKYNKTMLEKLSKYFGGRESYLLSSQDK